MNQKQKKPNLWLSLLKTPLLFVYASSAWQSDACTSADVVDDGHVVDFECEKMIDEE